jgi:hypothetical protein
LIPNKTRPESAESNKSAASQLDMGKSQSSINKVQKPKEEKEIDGSQSPKSPRGGDTFEKSLNKQLSFGADVFKSGKFSKSTKKLDRKISNGNKAMAPPKGLHILFLFK